MSQKGLLSSIIKDKKMQVDREMSHCCWYPFNNILFLLQFYVYLGVITVSRLGGGHIFCTYLKEIDIPVDYNCNIYPLKAAISTELHVFLAYKNDL